MLNTVCQQQSLLVTKELLHKSARARLPDQVVWPYVGQLPVESFVRAMPVFLNAEDALDVEKAAVFRFPDVDEVYTVEVRRGVAIVQEGAVGADSAAVDVAISSLDFKKLLGGLDSAAAFLVTADLDFAAGGRTDLTRFLALFKK